MSTPFVEAVDAELAELERMIAEMVEEQRSLTPKIFVLRSQRQALVTYRLTLTDEDSAAEPWHAQEETR